jgi:GTP cyclohydrolase I
MLDKSKLDGSLGREIRDVLVGKGVEVTETSVNLEANAPVIENHFRGIMMALGLPLTDDSLSGTPRRVAKMFTQEVFWGLDYNNFPKITTIENKMGYSNVLLERNIKVASMCEHHFVPIFGEAFVAYIPDQKIIGLSKLNRVVEFFARRPQVQERMVEQIYYALTHLLGTDNVAVLVRAKHACVQLRGVEDVNSDTVSSKLGGQFFEGSLRNEFLQLIRM